LYSQGPVANNRGLYVPAHGTGAAKSILVVNTNNYVTGYFDTLQASTILILPTSASTTNNSIWIG